MVAESSAFNKYGKPVLIVLGIALVIWLAWISMAVLIPFLVGILLACLLMPLVTWLEKLLGHNPCPAGGRNRLGNL
jgi:predicted PurR-regulated permease PerM